MSKYYKIKLILAFICFLLWIPLYCYRKSLMTTVTEQKRPSLHIPQTQHGDIPVVKITVYYESLCPDSKYFIVDQLAPTFRKLPAYIKTDLVPYGKATTRVIGKDTYEFTCQHGEVECQGNIYHACVIQHVSDQGTALEIIQCMISNNIDPSGIAEQCARKYGVTFNQISTCAEGLEGKRLLEHYGERTNINPPLTFVPTVLIDGDRRNQAKILKDLFKELCAHFKALSKEPKECDI